MIITNTTTGKVIYDGPYDNEAFDTLRAAYAGEPEYITNAINEVAAAIEWDQWPQEVLDIMEYFSLKIEYGHTPVDRVWCAID